MVSGGIKTTGLPEYHLAELSTINSQSYSDCWFEGVDHKLCVIFQANTASSDYDY